MSNQSLQEVEEPGQKEDEDREISKGREEEDHSDEGGSKMENPLDKYMKIVLEARQKQQSEVSFSRFCKTLQFCGVWTLSFSLSEPCY